MLLVNHRHHRQWDFLGLPKYCDYLPFTAEDKCRLMDDVRLICSGTAWKVWTQVGFTCVLIGNTLTTTHTLSFRCAFTLLFS